MTSKSSFFNLLKDNLTRRMWSLALSVLVFFFYFPISSLLISDSYLKDPVTLDASEIARLKRCVHDDFIYAHSGSILIIFLLCVLAVLIAFSAFSYLEDTKKTDFYHSLPISRNKLFLVNVINSLIITAAPYFVMSLLSAVIIQARTGYADCIPFALSAFIQNLGFYTLFLMTAVLAIMLTGTKPVGILGVLTLFFLGPVFVGLIYSYMSTYYHSFYYIADRLSELTQISSPVFWALALGTDTPVALRAAAAYILSAVLAAVNLKLYLIRKSECAGSSMAFGITRLPVKALITVTGALSSGLIFHSIMNNSVFWSVFAIVCACIILHCIIEIIYNQDFKALLKHKAELSGCLIASLAVFAFFCCDLMGYDSYLPDASKVESAGLYSGSIEECYEASESVSLNDSEYYSVEYTSSDKQVVDRMQLTDIGTLQAVAMQGIKDAGNDPYDSEYTDPYGSIVLIAWHLKNGKTVYRQYYMNLAEIHDELDKIIDSAEFKSGTYPILAEAEDNGENIKGISLEDALGYHQLSFKSETSAADMKALYDAYRMDLSELTAADRRSSMPVLTIQFRDSRIQEIADKLSTQSIYSDQLNYMLYYPVYPGFKRTLGLLSEYGVKVNDSISAEDINTIVVSDNTGYEMTEDGETKQPKANLIVSDKAEIAQILDKAWYSLNRSNSLFPQLTDIDVSAHLVNWHSGNEAYASYTADTGAGTYGVRNLYLYFRADEAPDFLKNYFEIGDDSIESCLKRIW